MLKKTGLNSGNRVARLDNEIISLNRVPFKSEFWEFHSFQALNIFKRISHSSPEDFPK